MSKILWVDVTRTTTDLEHELGAFYVDPLTGNHYVYIQANGAITQYAPVKFDGSYDCAVAGNGGLVWGVAQVAIADNSYGWLLVRGTGTADAATSTADNAALSRVADANGDLAAVSDVDEAGTDTMAAGALSAIGQTSAAESGGTAAIFLW